MSITLYVHLKFVKLHQKLPADYPPPYTTGGPNLYVADEFVAKKYRPVVDNGDPGENPQNDFFDWAEFAISSVSYTRPAAVAQIVVPTETGSEKFANWTSISVPDNFDTSKVPFVISGTRPGTGTGFGTGSGSTGTGTGTTTTTPTSPTTTSPTDTTSSSSGLAFDVLGAAKDIGAKLLSTLASTAFKQAIPSGMLGEYITKFKAAADLSSGLKKANSDLINSVNSVYQNFDRLSASEANQILDRATYAHGIAIAEVADKVVGNTMAGAAISTYSIAFHRTTPTPTPGLILGYVPSATVSANTSENFRELVTGGDDIVVLGSGTHTDVDGGAGNDLIKFQNGNDSAIDSSGNDTYVFGDGRDTLKMGGNRSGYTINKNGEDVTIRGANGEINKASGLERVQFSDGTLAFDTEQAAGQAYRVYQAAFARTPDKGGLSFWIKTIDSGASLKSVADGFLGSAEFARAYGTQLNDATFIAKLYQNVLGRAGEAAGTAFWLDQLSKGMARGDILALFSESPENKAMVAPAISDGIWFN